MSGVKFTRRSFLKTAGIVGGGLVIGYYALRDTSSPELRAIDGAMQANAFLQITPDNRVVFYMPRDEMGQGAYMGLTTLVAEELDVPLQDIQVEFAGVHFAYNNPDFGLQGTGGSTSMKTHYQPLRQMAANTRALLLNAAAQDLNTTVESLTTDGGYIVSGDERHPFGDFITTAQTLEIPEHTKLKSKAEFKYIGKETIRIDAMAKSTGTANYGIDIDLPNMHYALVKRCSVAGGSIASFDDSNAKTMPGVIDVVQIDNGIAVVAKSFWQAKKALAAVQVDWELPELANVSDMQIRADYQTALESDEGDIKDQGSLKQGFEQASKQIEREFWAPYLAHAPLEPMNAVVRIGDGEAEVWSGTQGPSVAQGLVARYSGVPKEKVIVHSTFLGGGFGRRAVLSHISEATQVAVATDKTIKLIWTREDDIQNGWFRPASLMKIHAGIDDDGAITAWDATRVGGNIMPDTVRFMLPGAMPGLPKGVTDWMANTSESVFDGWIIDNVSIEGLADDYDFPNKQVRHVTVNHGLPLAYWRSVGHSFTAFAKETIIDELAEQAGADPITFRQRNLGDNPRLMGVLKQVEAGLADWQVAPGRHIGVAVHASFASYVAQAAEVSVENNVIKVHRVLCSVDCGQVVNPDIVRAQMEGAIMFGLTAALHGDLQVKNGAITQSNFHDYSILRMNEAPAVEVLMIDSDEPPTGVGEPGLPPIAPAVANAVYKATGQRLSSLPLKLV